MALSPVFLYGYSMSSKRDHSDFAQVSFKICSFVLLLLLLLFSENFHQQQLSLRTLRFLYATAFWSIRKLVLRVDCVLFCFLGGEKFYQNMNTFLLLTDWKMQNRWNEDTWESNLYSTILRCIRHETYYKIIDTKRWRGSAIGNRTVKGQLAPGKL